jgi:hypothetical protein
MCKHFLIKRSTLKKNVELSISESFKKIIEEFVENGAITNLQELV